MTHLKYAIIKKKKEKEYKCIEESLIDTVKHWKCQCSDDIGAVK